MQQVEEHPLNAQEERGYLISRKRQNGWCVWGSIMVFMKGEIKQNMGVNFHGYLSNNVLFCCWGLISHYQLFAFGSSVRQPKALFQISTCTLCLRMKSSLEAAEYSLLFYLSKVLNLERHHLQN